MLTKHTVAILTCFFSCSWGETCWGCPVYSVCAVMLELENTGWSCVVQPAAVSLFGQMALSRRVAMWPLFVNVEISHCTDYTIGVWHVLLKPTSGFKKFFWYYIISCSIYNLLANTAWYHALIGGVYIFLTVSTAPTTNSCVELSMQKCKVQIFLQLRKQFLHDFCAQYVYWTWCEISSRRLFFSKPKDLKHTDTFEIRVRVSAFCI